METLFWGGARRNGQGENVEKKRPARLCTVPTLDAPDTSQSKASRSGEGRGKGIWTWRDMESVNRSLELTYYSVVWPW